MVWGRRQEPMLRLHAVVVAETPERPAMGRSRPLRRSPRAGAQRAPGSGGLQITGASCLPRRAATLGAVVPLLAVTALGLALGPVPAATAASPTPTPGMGAPVACATTVTYSIGGRTPAPRPLPPPVSQVGGAALAVAGLHVTPSATVAPPAPKATAWLVADLDTGQVLAACNAHVPLAPASSLKVLTALALMPLIDPANRYTARTEDARVDGTRVGLVPGSVYSVDDLWHALLMSSANDAAVALATLAGGLPVATAAMRRTAQALGAADTTAYNTSGLDAPGQVSSAYDLAVFGRAALSKAPVSTLLQTRSYAFPEAGTAPGNARTATGTWARKTFQIQNHNRLLYNYPGALGVKNGWTSTTGGSFIGAAQRGNRRLVATLLAADPETWHMSAALLDWGFSATPAGAPGVGRLTDGPDPAGALTAVAPAGSGGGREAAGLGGAAGTGRQAAASTTASGPLPRVAVAAAAATAILAVVGAAGALNRAARRSGRRN